MYAYVRVCHIAKLYYVHVLWVKNRAFFKFCEMLSNGAKRVWHAEHQVPYLIYDDQWFGYDDEASISNKVSHRYISLFLLIPEVE